MQDVEQKRLEKLEEEKKKILNKLDLIFEKEKIEQRKIPLGFADIFKDFENNIPASAKRILSLYTQNNKDAFFSALDDYSDNIEDFIEQGGSTGKDFKKLIDVHKEPGGWRSTSSRKYYLVWGNTWLYFYICLRLGYLDVVREKYPVSTIDHTYKETPRNIITFILFLYEIINTKPTILSIEEREKMQEIVEWFSKFQGLNIKYGDDFLDTDELLKYCRQKIIEIRLEDLDKQLADPNVEILTDQKKVQEYIKDFGFGSDYNVTLTKLDNYFNTPSVEGRELGGMIGTYREFFKDFYIDLAKKVASVCGLDEVPENGESTTPIGHSRHYITKEFKLSKEEHKFLDSYKDMTNDKGSHAMLTTKDHFRLMKNIGIEILLFLLSKFEEYKAST